VQKGLLAVAQEAKLDFPVRASHQNRYYISAVEVDPLLRNLGSDPRFEAMLAKL